jgi:hypothetical protein
VARRNRRADETAPLGDVTIPDPPRQTRWETEAERDARITAEFGRKRERSHRRQDARVLAAIDDWRTCCIPGCGEDLNGGFKSRIGTQAPPDPSRKLPVCTRHATIIHGQSDKRMDDPTYLEMRESLARQRVLKEHKLAAEWDCIEESGGATQGQIYFVRLNGMVKVGWSLKLRSRLKAYGASAEILCHYPASRSDETYMHRQLRPFLAKGREWYEDCKLISDVVAGIIEQHGEPTIFPTWTEPKPPTVAGKRYAA